MKVLLVGGAGFIGSHTLDLLLAEGCQVAVLDDLSTGRRERVPAGVPLEVGDVRDRRAVDEAFGRHRPEAVLHLAAQLNVRRSVADPVFDAQVNILGSLHVLEACRAYGASRLVFASSGGVVYGEDGSLCARKGKRPLREDHPCRPLSPYGVAKRTVETYLAAYRTLHGLSTLALRYANVYGPRQDSRGEAGVHAIFMERLSAGARCVIYGDGSKTRDYVHVADVARANLLALRSTVTGELNIGTGVPTRDDGVHAAVAAALGLAREPIYQDFRPGELRHNALNAERARAELGWAPRWDLTAGTADQAAWFKGR